MRTDDRGSGTITSFIVALAVFVVGFSSITFFLTDYVGKSSGTTGSNLESSAMASTGLDLLLGSSGIPTTWEYNNWSKAVSPDPQPDVLGLIKSGTKSTVSIEKLRRIQGYLPGYDPVEDAVFKESIGLPDHNLHLRTYPLYSISSDGTVAWPTGYPVAYVGQYQAAPGFAPDAEKEKQSLSRIHLGFTDNVAPSYPVAEGNVVASFDEGDAFYDTFSFLKARLLPRLAGFDYAYDLTTPDLPGGSFVLDYLSNNTYWKVINLSTYPANLFPADTHHVLTPSRYSAHAGGPMDWRYSYPDDNALVTPAFTLASTPDTVTLRLNQSILGVKRSLTAANDTTLDDLAGIYVICVENCGVTPVKQWILLKDWATNGATTPGDFRLNDTSLTAYKGKTIRLAFRWSSSAYLDTCLPPIPCLPTERPPSKGWFIKDLQVFTTTGTTRTNLWTNDLDYDPGVTKYGVVVFGTGVDQTPFNNDGLSAPETSTLFKTALKDWIQQGGRLLVLGSGSARNDWLAGVATQATSPVAVTGSQNYAATDLTHTLLTVPFTLDPTVFTSSTSLASYHYTPRAGSAFDDVLTYTSGPTLSVSMADAGFNGSVILTALMPGKFTTTEADHFFQNTIAFLRFRHIYLDHGPSIVNTGTVIGSSARNVLTETGDPEMSSVEMRVVLYLWG